MSMKPNFCQNKTAAEIDQVGKKKIHFYSFHIVFKALDKVCERYKHL